MLPTKFHFVQRRRLKCEKLTYDRRRTPSDGKSSHSLWQGELKMLNRKFDSFPDFFSLCIKGVWFKKKETWLYWHKCRLSDEEWQYKDFFLISFSPLFIKISDNFYFIFIYNPFLIKRQHLQTWFFIIFVFNLLTFSCNSAI